MRNYPEWVIAFAAITSIGAVSVSLNAWWTADELDYALEDCGATVLIADVERVERSVGACRRLGCRDRWRSGPPAPCPRASTAGRSSARRARRCPRSRSTPTTTPPSSTPRARPGTRRARCRPTGPSCRPSWRSAAGRRSTGCAGRPSTEEAATAALPPAFILIVPLFHVTGCVPVMLSCFVSGLKLVIMYKWDPERALELIEREQVTNFVGVPDAELGPARVAPLRRARHVEPRRASAAAARRRRPSS